MVSPTALLVGLTCGIPARLSGGIETALAPEFTSPTYPIVVGSSTAILALIVVCPGSQPPRCDGGVVEHLERDPVPADPTGDLCERQPRSRDHRLAADARAPPERRAGVDREGLAADAGRRERAAGARAAPAHADDRGQRRDCG